MGGIPGNPSRDRSPAAAGTPLRSIGSCCISGTSSGGARFTPRFRPASSRLAGAQRHLSRPEKRRRRRRGGIGPPLCGSGSQAGLWSFFPAAGEPAMPPVRPVNGPADRSYPMPARTTPVRTALPGFAFAAILLLAGCGGASQEPSAAPLTRGSSLCGQVADSRSAGETGRTPGSSSSASAICRVSSGISAGAAPARPQPPAVRLAPSPGPPDPTSRSGGGSGAAASSPSGHFDVRQAQRDYPSRRTADRCHWGTARERCTSDQRPSTDRRR